MVPMYTFLITGKLFMGNFVVLFCFLKKEFLLLWWMSKKSVAHSNMFVMLIFSQLFGETLSSICWQYTAVLPIHTFSHLQDGVPIKLWALDIFHLHCPHLGKAILSDVNRWVVESVLESHRANVIVKHGVCAVRHHSDGYALPLSCVVTTSELKLMACDKWQRQEIAIANTLSKVTVSFNVTALMKHQCVCGGVKGRLLHTKSMARH